MESSLNDTREYIDAIVSETNLCADSVSSLVKKNQDQTNEICLLRQQIDSKDELTKKVFAENAQCTIDSMSVLLNIIWPLTSNPDFQMSLFNNNEFICLLFDNFMATSEMLSSSNFSLLFPIIGILANLNSNPIIRSEIGVKSVDTLMTKPLQPNFKYVQVSIILLYNVCCGKSLIPELLDLNLLKYLNENLMKLTNYLEIYKKFIKILNLIFGLIKDDEIIRKIYSDQFREILMNENMQRYNDDDDTRRIKKKMKEFF